MWTESQEVPSVCLSRGEANVGVWGLHLQKLKLFPCAYMLNVSISCTLVCLPSACKITRKLSTNFDNIFKGECLCVRDKLINFWRGSAFFCGSWIIFQDSLSLAHGVHNDILHCISATQLLIVFACGSKKAPAWLCVTKKILSRWMVPFYDCS